MKKALKAVLCIVLALLLLAVGYLAYVLIDYHRLGDDVLAVSGKPSAKPQTEQTYKIVSYNIGFGAYEPDYGFFMDGGTESWAWSEERLDVNLGNIAQFLDAQDADLYILQEVDRDSTRSYHQDELVPIVTTVAKDFAHTWAQNYDSPYLLYPFNQPHGKSVSGLLTMSRFGIASAERVELPIENSLMKLVDLDRCYSINRIPMANGKPDASQMKQLATWLATGEDVSFDGKKFQKLEN